MKNYLDENLQIQDLNLKKNIDLETINVNVLKENSYSDIVLAYTRLIAIDKEGGNKIYNNPETFAKFIECNILDEAMASYLRCAIGYFEKRLKCFLIEKICGKMSSNGDVLTSSINWVINYKNGQDVFDLLPLNDEFYKGATIVAEPETIGRRVDLCDKLITIHDKPSSNNELAKNYFTKFGFVPMFLSIQDLSLNKLITLFVMLSKSDKLDFISGYYDTEKDKIKDVSITTFEQNLIRILIVRNIVNHYEPITPFIINIENKFFKAFLDIVGRLKQNYQKSILSTNILFSDLKILSFTGTSYSNNSIN